MEHAFKNTTTCVLARYSTADKPTQQYATDYAIAMQQRVIDLNVSDLLASLPYDMKPYLIMVVRPPGSCLSSHTA